MIQSMTAFARYEAQQAFGTVTWECRTVNHRYLETSWRLPESFRHLEPLLRDKARQYLQRGKLEVNLRFEPSTDLSPTIILNESLAKSLVVVQQQLATITGDQQLLRTSDLMKMPGVLTIKEQHDEQLDQTVLNLFDAALQQLLGERQREGKAIAELLLQRLVIINQEVAIVRQSAAEIVTKQEQRIRQRFAELQLQVDQSRVEQELVFLAQKIDVAEELDRLVTHAQEITRTIQQGGVVGRRLDFLIQELHREANTLGSKSLQADTTQSSVAMKVVIEQMREQIQNIE